VRATGHYEVTPLYRHLLFHEDGSEIGESHYGALVRPGDTIRTDDGRELRIVTVVAVDEQGSEYVAVVQASHQ
jgi:hypothetical protein